LGGDFCPPKLLLLFTLSCVAIHQLVSAALEFVMTTPPSVFYPRVSETSLSFRKRSACSVLSSAGKNPLPPSSTSVMQCQAPFDLRMFPPSLPLIFRPWRSPCRTPELLREVALFCLSPSTGRGIEPPPFFFREKHLQTQGEVDALVTNATLFGVPLLQIALKSSTLLHGPVPKSSVDLRFALSIRPESLFSFNVSFYVSGLGPFSPAEVSVLP